MSKFYKLWFDFEIINIIYTFMEKGYIYRIVSPTNRIYIGKTFNLKKRIESYKGLCCKGQRILFNSLSKHGWVLNR